jgi:transcriptional regulator with XRE-family HTH domain
LEKRKSSSKRLWLLAAAVIVILAVVAAPVWAAESEDSRAADAFAHLLGLKDAEALAAYLGLDNPDEEPCGPACSYYADNFAEAIDKGSAERLAADLGLKGSEDESAEDELARILHESRNLNQLATAVGLNSPEALADKLEVPRSELAGALRERTHLEAIAELEGLAESKDYDEDEFAQLLEDYSDDLEGLTEVLGFSRPNELARYLGLEDRRDLDQLLQDYNPQETDKLVELADLRKIARDLGFANLKEFADYMNVESRGKLVELLQEAKTPEDVAEAFGFESVSDLATYLDVDTSELADLLDEAKSDDGVANSDSDDEESASNDGEERSANNDGEERSANNDGDDKSTTSVSQESEQETESGDVNQSFTVTNSGDNSNQSAAVQGAANSGNSQSQTSVVQAGSEAEDIELEGGSSIEVSPELESQSQQAVEQAAAAAE